MSFSLSLLSTLFSFLFAQIDDITHVNPSPQFSVKTKKYKVNLYGERTDKVLMKCEYWPVVDCYNLCRHYSFPQKSWKLLSVDPHKIELEVPWEVIITILKSDLL